MTATDIEAIPDQATLPVCLPPWQENPYRLVSWFDVLHFSAETFAWSVRQLRIIRADAIIRCSVCVNGEVFHAMPQEIDGPAIKNILSSVGMIERSYRSIGMDITADTVKEFGSDLRDSSRRRSCQWINDRVDGIEKLAAKELKGRMFAYIPQEKAKFWPTTEDPFAFGKVVADRFSATTFDANSAAICLATSQSTAAAFHLMRVLEIGLRVLAGRFDVPADRQNWQKLIDGIEKAIRNMPNEANRPADWKDQQEFYSGVAMQFMFFKDAWRNYVAHGRDKCTEDEAVVIFDSVRTFMQKLATRLHE